MKSLATIASAALAACLPMLSIAAEPWQEVTMPTVAEVARNFPSPPREFGAIHWAIWGGQITRERILSDIERVNANGGGVYMINNSRGMRPAYFTPEYLDLVKYTVAECKKRGMKVWIEGEAGYPDGFAGGMISKQYPQLGMQGIVADARYSVAGGQTLSIPLPVDTLGIYATPRGEAGGAAAAEGGREIPLPADGKLDWTCPSGGTWEVTVHAPGGDGRYSVVAGQTLHITVPPDVTRVEAAPRAGGGRGGAGRGAAGGERPAATIIPLPSGDRLRWTAPAGNDWDVTFVRHVYRSSPTRFSNREDGTADKDSLYSLIDYLDPEATAAYIRLIHAKYQEIVGEEFGKTILGFRSDETDYTGFMPWTPKLLETFQKEKGYDLKPHIVTFFVNPLTPEAQRAKADYWDVWSGMFRDNLYKPLQEWARARNMDYMTHLNHEEVMINRMGGESMVANEGSFFRDMRYMGVPGVDNLNQIGPGIVADFPKLAASASHLFGRPLAWEEEGGGTGQNGKFIIDYQLVRGMNYMNIRGMNSPAAPTAAGDQNRVLQDPGAATGWYVTRSQYALAMGRPAAQVALYLPTDSYWLGDQEADTVTVKLTTELLEHQVDFDHIDEDSLASLCTLNGGEFTNLSGQSYRAVIVPTCTALRKTVLERLRSFAGAGGKVVFVGRTPSMVVGQTFLHPEPGAPDLSFATVEPAGEITERVIAALPRPDVTLDSPCPGVKYFHKHLKDGDVYFFFNESPEPQARTATLAGTGQVQIWDAAEGSIHPMAGVQAAQGSASVPLALAPHEARLVVIGPLPATAGAPLASGGRTLASLEGEWELSLGDRKSTTALKPWQELGAEAFGGIAVYRKTFDAPAIRQGERITLDLGTVREVAAIRINGKDLQPRSWTPFAWDVTDALKPGSNSLEVLVQVPAGGGRGGFGAGGAGGGGRGARGNAGGGGLAGGADAAAGNGRGGGRGAGRAGGGRGGAQAAAAPAGLIGPVRLVSQER